MSLPRHPRIDMRYSHQLCFLAGIALVMQSFTATAWAQQETFTSPAISAGSVQVQLAAPTDEPPSTPPTASTEPSATSPNGAKPAATADAATPPAVQDSIKRPPAAQYVPMRIDAEIRRNPDGLVAFNLIGQPWEAVLRWLSDASALSLDWQELPADSLNLITTREYSMEEARDLINRHLLMRGFTMIVRGELMSIMRTKDLNSAMVARVSPSDLATLPDHTICKVSFNLDSLIADEAVEELKPMLSSAGQIHKLSRTNRLEILDTAASLRQIWELLQDEQSESGDDQLVRAFRLEHRRAEDVIRLLRELLKLRDSGGASEGGDGMDPNMAMQMMQQMQQMQQAMQQAAAQPGAAGGGKAPKETRLVLNQRENMILAQAAPDQMAVIERAIKEIDIPRGNHEGLLQNINRMKIYRLESVDPQTLVDLLQQLGDLDPATVLKVDRKKKAIMAWASLADHLTITTLVEKLDQSSRQFEVITLRRLDAEYVAGTIRMLMDVEPKEEDNNNSRQRYFGFYDFNQGQQQQEEKERSFRIEADIENNRLLVNANALEMDEIRNLLVKLGELPDPNATDDGVRVFEINKDEDLHELRRQLEQYWRRGNRLEFDLPPELPKSKEESDAPADETSADSTKSSSGKPAKSEKRSAPGAVTKSNIHAPRVSIWNDGHRQANGGSSSAFDELLRRDTASQSATSPLLSDSAAAVLTRSTIDEPATAIENEEAAEPPATEAQTKAASDESNSEPAGPVIDRKLIDRLREKLQKTLPLKDEPDAITDRLPKNAAADEPVRPRDAERFPSEETRDAPIRFSITPDGKLIASSRDLAALADLEALMGQVATPRRSYKLFRLKYATPSWVTLNLKDFFKSEEQTKSGFEYDPYYGIMPSQKKTKGNHSLSKRRQPMFISDNFTSTILVRDADAKQLQTIEDLIAIYDVPEPSDARSMRVTTIFRLEHARATSVAAAVKDVFRDLLSSNDKALATDDKGERQASSGLVTFLRGAPSTGGEDSEEEPIRFKGLLSIGIDESSNTLIVSSTGSLMDTIGEMIESLDKAADSSSVVQVIHVDKSVDLALIQERLRELMNPPVTPPQPGQQPGQPAPGQFPGQQPPGGPPGANPAAAE